MYMYFLTRDPTPVAAAVARDDGVQVGTRDRGADGAQGSSRSAARLAHAKVPADVGDVTAGARTFVSRSHAVEREAHVATVTGDIVTPPSLRTRRTTYDRRAAPAPRYEASYCRRSCPRLPCSVAFSRRAGRAGVRARSGACAAGCRCLCGNQSSGALRHRRDIVSGAASAFPHR